MFLSTQGKRLNRTSAIIFSTLACLSACSLNYGEQTNTQSSVPEFIFTGTEFKRYEDGKISMEMDADTLEQYKANSTSFAKNAKFKTWNKDGELDTEGSCALLSMDSTEKLYTMFSSVLIKNYSQKMELRAENLKWNGKNEQLVSGINDTVFLKKDNLELTGRGFSASGVSKSFAFSQPVTGTMTTETASGDTSKAEESEKES